MIGRVAVGIILPESSAHAEDWDNADPDYHVEGQPDPDRRQMVLDQIVRGLDFWAAAEEDADLTFVYEVRTDMATSYEPIGLSSQNDALWINEVMSALGYTGGEYRARVRQYDADLRNRYQTDWAFTIFVVDSLNDTNGLFADGWFAYTWVGGPFTVMTYDNDSWGLWRMDMITSHEVGHVFLALDEYPQAGVACSVATGYLGIPNRNSLVPSSGCLSNVDCVMRSHTWPAPSPCLYTRGQLGWRDSDSDGILDPVDTVSLALSARPPDLTSRATGTYAGTISNMPWPASSNYYYSLGATSINTTTAVVFRVDDAGPWLPATAADGAFDEDSETFTLTTPMLADGVHTTTIRSANRWGPERRDTFTVDATPPSVAISLPLKYPGAHFLDCQVARSGEDAASGVASYDLQYRSGDTGTWTGWLTATTRTSQTFVAPSASDATYYFHARARDRVGNVSEYSGPVSYTVDICDVVSDTCEAATGDDTDTKASWIGLDGTPQLHNMHDAGDQDWVKFYANPGVTYTIATSNDGGYADTVLKLYNTNGTAVITTNDNVSGSLASRIAWKPGASGTYYARVTHADPYAYGCDTAYSLAITTSDHTPPSSSVQPLPALSYVLFPVRWSGTDAGTGVASYDVQYREGADGAWTPWLTATTATTATFAGVVDHTYYFRCRATDRAGNVEDWPAEPDAYTMAYIWHYWVPLVIRK